MYKSILRLYSTIVFIIEVIHVLLRELVDMACSVSGWIRYRRGATKGMAQTFRGLQNCSELPQKTTCCQETTTAGREKSSGKSLSGREWCSSDGCQKPGEMQLEVTEWCDILPVWFRNTTAQPCQPKSSQCLIWSEIGQMANFGKLSTDYKLSKTTVKRMLHMYTQCQITN